LDREDQVANHPEKDTRLSDVHSISIIPVFDITGLGIVAPDNLPISTFWEQSIAVQRERTTKSYPDSVSKAKNCKVIEVAPVGAMIPDIVSLFEYGIL